MGIDKTIAYSRRKKTHTMAVASINHTIIIIITTNLQEKIVFLTFRAIDECLGLLLGQNIAWIIDVDIEVQQNLLQLLTLTRDHLQDTWTNT